MDALKVKNLKAFEKWNALKAYDMSSIWLDLKHFSMEPF